MPAVGIDQIEIAGCFLMHEDGMALITVAALGLKRDHRIGHVVEYFGEPKTATCPRKIRPSKPQIVYSYSECPESSQSDFLMKLMSLKSWARISNRPGLSPEQPAQTHSGNSGLHSFRAASWSRRL